MSPELVLGTALDARSDVFGVGVVLYEMVTGRRLFAGSDDIATLKLVSSAAVPPPSAMLEDTPEELEQIIMRALARDPEARWPSAGEMAHALIACIAAEDPTFGTRYIAELMRELFKDDIVAEQRRLNELMAASQDAELMERRRRFLASPMGAAAVAKAEAARKLASARPPPPVPSRPPPPMPLPARSAAQSAFATPSAPPAATGGAPAATRREAEDGNEDALTTYRDPVARAPSASRASAFGAASGGKHQPAPPDAPPEIEQSDNDEATRARLSSKPVPGDGLTAAATYDELIRGADASPDPEAERTSFYDESSAATTPPKRERKQSHSEEELTSFYAEPTVDERAGLELEEDDDEQEEEDAQPSGAAGSGEEAQTIRPELKAPAPLDRITLRAPDPAQAPAADAAVAAAYEEEPTSYLSRERPLNPALELVAAGQGAGPFDEENTHIFFSTESGIGLPDVPQEELSSAPAPAPLRVPPAVGPATLTGTSSPAGAQPAPLGGAVRARARVAQKLLRLPAASATGRHLPLTAAQAGQHASASPLQAASSKAALPEGDPFRPPARAGVQRAPLLWMAGALLLVLVTGVLVKTPLGVQLGLRKPPDGVIEIRTAPEVAAAVRLDGIYRGRAPLRLEGVPAGNRVLALEADGYSPVSRLITLDGGATVRENIHLNPLPKAASELAAP
jgi:hypothetical protein